MKTCRWGILGPGHIAERVIRCFPYASGAEVLAVASRTPGKAKSFAGKWGIPRSYESYEALVIDPDIDIVYIATPNSLHCTLAKLAMEHGKHVLVEKPIAMSAAQAREMAACAKENGVFLMQGIWTRFFPAVRELKALLHDGVIGSVHNLQADFAYSMPYIAGHRMFEPALGGGALMDVGIYSLAFASDIYGAAPVQAVGLANKAYGVDLRANGVLQFPGGGMASFFCSCDTRAPETCRIFGEKGWIEVPKFYAPSGFRVHLYGCDHAQEYTFPLDAEGFQYEITAVSDCVRQGLMGCPLLPLEETVALMEVMDKLRSDWGIRFPTDI